MVAVLRIGPVKRTAKPGKSALRPKRCLLSINLKLRNIVASKLILDWSPKQISGWLKTQYPDDESMRGVPRNHLPKPVHSSPWSSEKELLDHLRSKRRIRRSQHSRIFKDGAVKSLRPSRSAKGPLKWRTVPFRVTGRAISCAALGTVTSQPWWNAISRFVMLIKVPSRDTVEVVGALSKHVRKLPATLRRSLTWDRGLEMAKHKEFTVATDVKVYFCDPQSPWQRGSNENTNGLLRQYFPKNTDLTDYSQSDLNKVALRLNQRHDKL